jgi:uncharacterized membrane protein YoaK (UPF0700 family)
LILKSRSNLALACGLSAIAGYVDGIGFIHLGGLFVSFMSGNSTRLGVSAAEGDWPKALHTLLLLGLFVLGAAIGTLMVQGTSRYRQSMLLLLEAMLLAAAAACYPLGLTDYAIAGLVVAMGLENAVFQAGGGAGLGLTYVTGALVKVGQTLAQALDGGPRWAWLPNLLLWLSLVLGSLSGAYAYHRINLDAIWIAAIAALFMCAIFAVRARLQRQ